VQGRKGEKGKQNVIKATRMNDEGDKKKRKLHIVIVGRFHVVEEEERLRAGIVIARLGEGKTKGGHQERRFAATTSLR